LEHAIQVYGCISTQSFSDSEIKRLAKVLNMKEEEFIKVYKEYTIGVSLIFSGIMPSLEEEELHPIQRALLNEDIEEAKEILKSLGFREPVRAYNILSSYITGREGIKLSTQEKQSFIKLLPRLVESLSQTPDPDETLSNFDKFFSNPTGRKIVLSPAKEDVNKTLCRIFSLSSYISTLISRYPDLVEDVLTLYQDFPELGDFKEEFEKYRSTLSLGLEDLYRRFKKVWEIRITLVYLVKKNERYKKLFEFFQKLSELSDFLLQRLWEDLKIKDMLLIALGKYGSSELNIGSDLDLVFACRSAGLENTKKAQEFIAFLTKHTSEGYLYKVDFRLRPMGRAGEIAPSIDFYRDYFQTQARTWERIAWTRCRYVAGEKSLMEEFEALLKDFLFNKPIGDKERKEIRITLVYLVKKNERYKKLFEFFQKLSELSDFLLQRLWEDLKIKDMLLIALGKYGSSELNIGSDLDLVFACRSAGLENTKKAQEFIAFLTKHTSEGYLYKVDFRLRPMGRAGEIAPSIDFYRDYFQTQARTWERIAWTRCRYVAGEKSLMEEFEALLKDFLFNKPIGDKERKEIRDMRFALEGNAKKMKGYIDLKFSPGGLIDAEFLIQYYILLEKLREPSMIKACEALMQKYSTLKEVYENYLFLRLVETRLRLSKESAGSLVSPQDMKRLASSLGMQGEELEERIRESMKRLREVFLEVFD